MKHSLSFETQDDGANFIEQVINGDSNWQGVEVVEFHYEDDDGIGYWSLELYSDFEIDEEMERQADAFPGGIVSVFNNE